MPAPGILRCMLATVRSCLLIGLRGVPLDVQVDIGNGSSGLTMTGLPATSVKESTARVRSAVINSGLDWPAGRHTTVNLAPAELRKEGSGLDLPTTSKPPLYCCRENCD